LRTTQFHIEIDAIDYFCLPTPSTPNNYGVKSYFGLAALSQLYRIAGVDHGAAYTYIWSRQ